MKIFEFNFHYAGLNERLNREMMQIRPFQTLYNVVIAKDVNLNAWHGAKDFANSNDFNERLTKKSDYLEYGGEYFNEHYASNKYFSTPVVLNEPIQTVEAENSNNLDNDDTSLIKMDEEIFVE